jgi:hypothetical protein
MPTIEGIVSAVSVKTRPTPYGDKQSTSFNIDGVWYSGGFKPWEVDKGDVVQLTYETNAKGYNDVKGIAVMAKGDPTPPANTGTPRIGRSFPVDPLATERTINRQNALTAAVAFTKGVDTVSLTPEDVIHVARIFEAYTTGDIDKAEAMAMAAERA